jgi:hypothetical protein
MHALQSKPSLPNAVQLAYPGRKNTVPMWSAASQPLRETHGLFLKQCFKTDKILHELHCFRRIFVEYRTMFRCRTGTFGTLFDFFRASLISLA